MNLNKHFIWGLFLIIFFSQCREVEEPESIGWEYFPLNVGNEWLFQIDSTFHQPFSGDSTDTTFHRKNTITRTLIDPAGRMIYEMEQSQRANSQAVWAYQKTFFMFKDRVMAEINEDNVKLVPMVFPIKQNKVWDGNQLNNKGVQPFVYKDVGFTRRINGQMYRETFKVKQLDDSTFFDQYRDIEYYGKDVGLIYKEHINITTKNNNKSGIKVVWTLLEHTN